MINYRKQIYWSQLHNSQIIWSFTLCLLRDIAFDPQKKRLCGAFYMDLVDVQISYYESVVPCYHSFLLYLFQIKIDFLIECYYKKIINIISKITICINKNEYNNATNKRL